MTASANNRPGYRLRSSMAPNTGPPTAAETVSPAISQAAVFAVPVTVSPSSSKRGPGQFIPGPGRCRPDQVTP
jgi:hypothetical protein